VPGVCRTCRHPQRAAIDVALATGGSTRKVGAQFGVHFQAVARHAARCIPEKIAKANAERSERLDANQLLDSMLTLQKSTDALLASALAEKIKHVDVARVVRECRENGRLLGRLIGAFPREGTPRSTTIDARTQIVALEKMSTDELRALTQALAPRVGVRLAKAIGR
jgi:hypothetical protein